MKKTKLPKLVTKIRLFRNPCTIWYISEKHFVLPDEQSYKLFGLKEAECCEIEVKNDVKRRPLKLVANALFLQPFLKECLNSIVYRANVLNYLNDLSGNPKCRILYFKFVLKPPDQEILDYAWNDRMLKLVWSRVEIENAFSWLSTLGGAYSALGDYFEHCAEEAGRISIRQYKLSRMLGDDGLAARSKLYSALSHSQKGNLKLSRHIVRNVAAFGRATHDKRLICMCQGVWAKLKYLRALAKKPMSHVDNGGDSDKKSGCGNGKACGNGKTQNVK